jgi:hypothetical protein
MKCNCLYSVIIIFISFSEKGRRERERESKAFLEGNVILELLAFREAAVPLGFFVRTAVVVW